MVEEKKPERRTLERIIEQIGPFGLIAVCITLLVTVASKPLDVNSWVSILIISMIIVISFFVDWLRMKNSSEIEQLRIRSELEFKKHKSWEESTRPMMESSRVQGQERMDRFKILRSIIQLIEHDLKEDKITDEQQAYCQDLLRRLKDLERTIRML